MLIECIKLVIALKEQITNLVRFFKAVATVIDIAVTSHVEPFLETIKALVAADGTDPNDHLKIGDFTFTDLQRSVRLFHVDRKAANDLLTRGSECVQQYSHDPLILWRLW